IKKIPLPFATSAKRYLLASQPIHPTGEKFTLEVEYKGYYLEAHKERDIGLKHLQKLLAKADLEIQILSY
ncbi:MAG: hypothetical protein IT297_07150, partial [Anaerolineae bacterium]|nr:hypothetical protein [Anaerolineae bacterium]